MCRWMVVRRVSVVQERAMIRAVSGRLGLVELLERGALETFADRVVVG
jgi:hypothetical protein